MEDRIQHRRNRTIRHQYYTYAYTVNGVRYEGNGSVPNGEFSPTEKIDVRYDPDHPAASMSEENIRVGQLHDGGGNSPLVYGPIALLAAIALSGVFWSDQPKLTVYCIAFGMGFLITAGSCLIEGRKLITRIRGRR